MAKDDKVDQEKVKADAEKIAGGQSTENTAEKSAIPPAASAPSGDLTGATKNQPLSQNNAAGASQNMNTANGGNIPVKEETVIDQGNPGAKKPGEETVNAKQSESAISAEDAEEKQHNDMLRQFGPDYVRAEKKFTNGQAAEQTTFSRIAWDLLGPIGKDGTKDGWRPVVKVPKEVRELQDRQQAAK